MRSCESFYLTITSFFFSSITTVVHTRCRSDVFVLPLVIQMFKSGGFPAQTQWGFPTEESAPCWFRCYNVRPQVSFPKNLKVSRSYLISCSKILIVFQEHQLHFIKPAWNHFPIIRNKQIFSTFPLSFRSSLLFLEVKKHFGNVFGCKIIDNIFQKMI